MSINKWYGLKENGFEELVLNYTSLQFFKNGEAVRNDVKERKITHLTIVNADARISDYERLIHIDESQKGLLFEYKKINDNNFLHVKNVAKTEGVTYNNDSFTKLNNVNELFQFEMHPIPSKNISDIKYPNGICIGIVLSEIFGLLKHNNEPDVIKDNRRIAETVKDIYKFEIIGLNTTKKIGDLISACTKIKTNLGESIIVDQMTLTVKNIVVDGNYKNPNSSKTLYHLVMDEEDGSYLINLLKEGADVGHACLYKKEGDNYSFFDPNTQGYIVAKSKFSILSYMALMTKNATYSLTKIVKFT